MQVKIYNLIILDESGSMAEIKSATIRGFNEVVQTIKSAEEQLPGQEHFISLTTFNSMAIRTKLDRAKASELQGMKEDDFNPNASTPLYDAIGFSVVKLRNDIKTEVDAKVLVTILTDGEENASREYTGKLIRQIIEDQKRKGWTFTYIGANHDVEKAAGHLSIQNHLCFEADVDSMQRMFVQESNARMSHYKKIGRTDLLNNFFTDEINKVSKTTIDANTTEPAKETFLKKVMKKIKV
jgi:Mg-chelatase subunit ChlD